VARGHLDFRFRDVGGQRGLDHPAGDQGIARAARETARQMQRHLGFLGFHQVQLAVVGADHRTQNLVQHFVDAVTHLGHFVRRS
jgi:hypothetical protein